MKFSTVYQKNKNPTTDFLWIQKLTGSVRSLDNTSDPVQSTTEPVNRQID